jgi:hypothetical protein
MKNKLDAALRNAERRFVAGETKELPKARLAFEPPLSVTKATWRQPGYGLLFCVHGRSYFEPCNATTCRRTKKEADSRLQVFLTAVKPKP